MPYDDEQAWRDADGFGMTIYYIFLLKKGPIWTSESTPELDRLQEAHLANYRRLGEEGKLVLNGPFLDSFQLVGDVRGAGLLKAKSYDEAYRWVSTDPMVKIGHLVFELHAWMVEKGILP